MKAVKVFLIVILLAGLGFIVYRSFARESKVTYTTTHPEKRDISETIFIPGNVFPAKEIEIKPQLSGILEEIYVKIGDNVDVYTPIASIKLVPSASDLERLENNVNVAQIDYDARLTEYEREKHLYESHVIAQSEMDDYTKAYKLAKENLLSAKNQLDILKKGKVVAKNIVNTVTSSTAGTVIDIPLESGASVIDMKYLLDAEFAITDKMPILRSGYSATAEIVLKSHKNVLSIEEKYLTYQKDSTYLYVLNAAKNEKIKKRVDLSISNGVYTEITGGVAVNDKVITNHDTTD